MESQPDKIKDGFNAFIISAVMVIFFVGNAYIVTSYGGFGKIGDKLVDIGIYLAMPPVIPLLIISKIGIEVPLRGRESFIESNLWLWFYCILFYTLFIYIIIRSWKKFMRYYINSKK